MEDDLLPFIVGVAITVVFCFAICSSVIKDFQKEAVTYGHAQVINKVFKWNSPDECGVE